MFTVRMYVTYRFTSSRVYLSEEEEKKGANLVSDFYARLKEPPPSRKDGEKIIKIIVFTVRSNACINTWYCFNDTAAFNVTIKQHKII